MKNVLKNISASAILYVLAFVVVPVVSSCRDDSDDSGGSNGSVQTYKVAVIMPGDQQHRWERVAAWAQENLAKAQNELEKVVRLELEWFDEDDEEGLVDFVSRVEADPEYKAIIGPLYTKNAYTVATMCEKHHKTLLLPMCTSTEVQRIFAESPNVFNLTQSDIGQVEVLVSTALARHAQSISLLVHCGDVTTAEYQRSYGATFRNWVGFLASEAGLAVDTVCTYDDNESLERAVRGLSEFYAHLYYENLNEDYTEDTGANSVLLFVPERAEELLEYDNYRGEYTSLPGRGGHYPFTLCSSSVVSSLLEYENLGENYEGIDVAPAATSGFIPAYQGRYDYTDHPIGGEPQLFDALYLLTYALAINPDDVSASIVRLTDTEDGGYFYSWTPMDVGSVLSYMQSAEDILIPVGGALGKWAFDKRYHASLMNTTYRHWRLANYQFRTLEYITLGSGKRSLNNEQLWQMNVKVAQDFNMNQRDSIYMELDDNFAVVVAASTGWANYRHQADALYIYQMLKKHGYDDDHIILIMEGDILTDTNNKHPGEVRVRPDGENLYKDVTVDYQTSALRKDDLYNILTGKVTMRTPTVLESTNDDNVLFFWSGHGNDGVLYLDRNNILDRDMEKILGDMFLNGIFRKMFFVIEACYSGSVAEYCEGTPGLLMLTAANPSETSLADIMDPEMNIWLSNGFTRAFCEAVENDNNISMRNLYYHVAQQTVGSHATMYNHYVYGNMFTNTMKEYLP